MNGLFPNSLYTIHQGKSGGRGLSPRLWTNVDGQALSPDGLSNMFFSDDDFNNFGAIAPGISGTTSGVSNGYGYYVDTATSACTIQQKAEKGGVVRFTTGATDNHEAWLQAGGNTGSSYVVDTSSPSLLIWEARVKIGSISIGNYFAGLMEEARAAADTITDAGALADKDLLGFWVLEGAPTSLKYGYRVSGGSVVAVGSYTVAASTWYKLGLIYNPKAPAAKRIKFFIDNTEQTSYVTSTVASGSTFPTGQVMSSTFGVKNSSAASITMDVDWYGVGQDGQ